MTENRASEDIFCVIKSPVSWNRDIFVTIITHTYANNICKMHLRKYHTPIWSHFYGTCIWNLGYFVPKSLPARRFWQLSLELVPRIQCSSNNIGMQYHLKAACVHKASFLRKQILLNLSRCDEHAALALENDVANLRIASSQLPVFTSGGSRDGKLKALPFRLGRVWIM